jgi:cell wall-associated NlpC family hydrolase
MAMFNGIKYVKNLTKSFGYAMVDVVGDMNPTLKSFTETNQELGKELYATVTDWKGTVKKAKTAIVESDVYEFAKTYKENLFEDLKNGTFYNKARKDEYEVRLSGWSDEQLKEDFGDMFDDDDDINFDDWDEDDLRSDLFIAESMDDVGEKISAANAEVTTKSAEYIVRGQKESTKILYQQNNALMGQALKGMAAINSNLGQLAGMPEMMQVQVNNASKFFEDTTGRLDHITELLENISNNTNLSNEFNQSNEKSDDFTFSDIIDSKGMPNLKKYFSVIKKNIANSSSEFDMLGNLFGGGNVALTFAASPLEELMKAAVKQVIPKVLSSSMDRFNSTLQGFFGSLISKINGGYGSDNPIINWVSKIFGIDSSLNTDIDPSRYEKGKVAWDGVSRKALVEVIPGQLSKIVSALTGESPLVFDPESGTMKSITDIYDNAKNRVKNSANYAGSDVRAQIYDVLDKSKYSFRSYNEKKRFEDDLNRFFMYAFNAGGIDGRAIKRRGEGGLSDIGIDNSKLLEGIFEKISETEEGRNSLLNLNRRILRERDSLSNHTKYMERKGSIESYLSNGMFDDYLYEFESDDNKKLRAAGYSTMDSLSGVQTFAKQIDDYGHNIFYYLQEQLMRLDKIYEFTDYMVENGVNGDWIPRSDLDQDRHLILTGGSTIDNNRLIRARIITPSGHYVRRPPSKLNEIEPDEYLEKTTAKYILDDYNRRQSENYINERNSYRQDNPDFMETYNDDTSGEFSFKVDVERDIENREEKNRDKNWIDRLLSEKTLEGKLGVFQEKTQDFLNKPLLWVSNMLDSANEKVYKLIYGTDIEKDLEEKGLIGILSDSIHNTFDNVNLWIDDNILAPLKAKLGLRGEEGGLLTKVADVMGWDIEKFKRDKARGIFGTYDEDTKTRSGGLLGDYMQSVKDAAKDVAKWGTGSVRDVRDTVSNGLGLNEIVNPYADTETEAGSSYDHSNAIISALNNASIKADYDPVQAGYDMYDQIFGNSEPEAPKPKNKYINEENENRVAEMLNSINGYAVGGQVKKTGIAAVSEGELIIPSELNPYYKGTTNKAQQMKDEDNAVKKFFGKYASGTTDVGDGNNGYIINIAINKVADKLKKANTTREEIAQYLQDNPPDKELDADGEISYYVNLAKKYLNKKISEYAINKLTGAKKKIVKYDNSAGNYTLSDGTVMTMKAGEYVKKVGGEAKLFASNSKSFLGDSFGQLGSAFKSVAEVYHRSTDNRKGSDTPESQAFDEMIDDVKENFTKDYAGATTVGAGIGGLASLITGAVGGPLLGAAVGGAVGLTLKSNKVQDWLFGKEVDTDEGKKLEGGVLSEQASKFIKEKLPDLAKFGLVGGAAGTITGHPLLGTFIGSGIGFAKNSEKFQSLLFNTTNKQGHTTKGLFNMTSEQFNDMIAKRLPKMGAGAIAGLALGPFGLVPNLVIGSAIGFASDTNTFKDTLLGKVNEKTNKREGGLIEELTKTIFKPFVNFGKNTVDRLTKWLDDEIMGRISKSIEPIAHYFETQGLRFARWICRGFKGVCNAIGGSTTGRRIYRRIIEPVRNAAGNLANTAIDIAKAPITFGAKALENRAMAGQAHDIRLGYTDNLTIDEVMDQYKNNPFLTNYADGNVPLEIENTKDANMYRMQAGVYDLKKAGDLKRLKDLQGAVDAMGNISTTYKQKQKNIIAEMRDKTLNDYNIRQSNKDRLVGLVKAGKLNEDNIDEYLSDIKAVNGESFSYDDRNKLREALLTGAGKLADLKSDYTTLDENGKSVFEKNQKKIIEQQMKDFGIADDKFAKFIFGNQVQRERFAELLGNTINKMEEENIHDEDKSPEEKIGESVEDNVNNLNNHMQDRHDELIDLIKQAINTIAARTGGERQFAENGDYIGENSPVNSKGATNKAKDIVEDAEKKANESLTDNPSDKFKFDQDLANEDYLNAADEAKKRQDDATADIENFATAATGGKVNKSGLAAVSKGELILPEFYGKFADGGIIGALKGDGLNIPGYGNIRLRPEFGGTPRNKTITSLDGTYVYDEESHEYEAADAETRAADAKKEKLKDSLISIPDKLNNVIDALGGTEDADDKEKESNGFLSSILSMLGLTGASGIGATILKFASKGIGFAMTLLGPIAAAALMGTFFSGKLDGIINTFSSTIGSYIMKLLGADEDVDTIKSNISQSGENGEDGASDIVKYSLTKDFLKGGKHFKAFFRKANEKLANNKLFRNATVLTKGTNFVSNAYNTIANKLFGGAKDAAETVVEDSSESLWGSFLEHNGDNAASAIMNEGDDLARAAASGNKEGLLKKFTGLFKNKNVETAAESGVEKAAESSILQSALKSSKEAVSKVLAAIAGHLPEGLKNNISKIKDAIDNLIETQAKKKAEKDGVENAAKLIPLVGKVVTVAFFVADYLTGYNKASSILGVENPTACEKVISGLVNGFLGIGFFTSLIPSKLFITTMIDVIGPLLGIDSTELKQRRQEYADKVESYNEENGTNYSIEQYNSSVNGEKGFFEKTISNVKSLFSSKARTTRDSMLDSDGNVVAGALDKTTKRWKKFWQKKVDNGMDQSYAEALYRNEILHDSSMSLTDDYIADLQEKIQKYQQTSGSQQIPDITVDLNGLIRHNKANGQKGANVSYGDTTTADYVGNYALGGIIKKTGLAALSKGEMVVDNAKDAISAITSKLFGGLGNVDISGYESVTDLGTFISDLMNLDVKTNGWEEFWKKADADDEDSGALAPIKKLIKRLIASMVAPVFAMNMSMNSVAGTFSNTLGTSNTTDTSDQTTTTTSSSSGSKSLLSMAASAAKGVLSKVSGGIKKFFGGGTGKEDYDSEDGTFISQISDKYANLSYGNSTFADEGCAPATAAMFLNNTMGNQYGASIEDAAKYAVSGGYKVDNDGTKDQFFKDYFTTKGIDTESIQNSKGIYDSIAAGKPTVLLGQDAKNTSKKKSPFGKDPHYVLATGVDENGNIIVNDPEAKKGGKAYNKSILNGVKNAIAPKKNGGRSGLMKSRLLSKHYGGGTALSDMHMGENGLNLLKSFETCKLTAYKGAGESNWTIGWGHCASDVKQGQTITQSQADNYLKKDVVGSEDAVKKYMANASFTPNQNQFDALVDYVYNRGSGAAKELFNNCKTVEEFSNGILKYWGSNTASYKGIMNRRKAEYNLFNSSKDNVVTDTSDSSTSTDSSSSSSSDGISGLFTNGVKKILTSMYGSDVVNFVYGDDSDDDDSSSSDDTSSTDTTSSTSAATITDNGATVSSSTTIGEAVAKDAYNYIGNKYVLGGNDLNNGIDCSGFAQQLYKKQGFTIPERHSSNQYTDSTTGKTISGGSFKDLKPGDVMFFSNNGKASGIHHVGIYVGNDTMVHASNSSPYPKGGVKETKNLSTNSYYVKEYVGAKRYGSGSGLIDQSKVVDANRLFGGAASSTEGSISSTNAVKARKAKENSTAYQMSDGIKSIASSISNTDLSSITDSISSLLEVLNKIADNTSVIATICDLIKKIIPDNGDNESSSTTKADTTLSSSGNKATTDDEKVTQVVDILMKLAQA